MGNVLRHDAERLRVLLERHLLYTGSARAAALLDDWQNAVTRFVKVMPKDYRRALQDIEAEQLAAARSEEHTSELQSLMRISYAVFCLKKKKKLQNNPSPYHHSTT